MRMRTTLTAGVLAVAAILGSTGTALAHDRDDHYSSGRKGSCATFAAANGGNASFGSACKHSEWMGQMGGWMGHHSH
ncbi:hypothetical protein ABZ734_00210 [Streptomyces sp. NPDC006660]|uniref:hypothetical protein n=2 Tax=Streptomyces TaxID=1883 RepID=UPI003404482B